MKRKALLPYVGLPNILAGEFVVPELLQDDATPANLAQALGNWLDNKEARDAAARALRRACTRASRAATTSASSRRSQPYLSPPPGGPTHANPQRNDLAALRG